MDPEGILGVEGALETLPPTSIFNHKTKKEDMGLTTPSYRGFRLLKRPHERSQFYLFFLRCEEDLNQSSSSQLPNTVILMSSS